jgi:non-heme chloroperoxidase
MKISGMQRRHLLQALASAAAVRGSVKGASNRTQNGKPIPFPYIQTGDRTSLFYKEWGTGRPVVFVHGWALNADMWQYQMLPLSARGLRCIAFDRRGHGRSTDPGSGYDFDTLSSDLASVIEQLNLRDVVLVGHSMGAAEIVRYLTRHTAARVSRIALISPSLPFSLKTADNPDGVEMNVLEQVRKQLATDFPKWLADNAPPFFAPDTSPEMIQWAIRMVLESSLRAIIECNRADVGTDFRAELPKITVPTLIVHGDHDHSAPLDFTGRRVAQLIPGSELKVYEGGTHGLFVPQMDRLNRDLFAFIKG